MQILKIAGVADILWGGSLCSFNANVPDRTSSYWFAQLTDPFAPDPTTISNSTAEFISMPAAPGFFL